MLSHHLVRTRGSMSRSLLPVFAWLAVGGTALVGCKKEAPPAPPPPPPAAPAPAPPAPPEKPALPEISCPPAETFAAFLQEPPPAVAGQAPKKPSKKSSAAPSKTTGKGRVLRTSCIVFSPGRFWTAVAFSYDEKTREDPRMGLISGAASGRAMIFDLVPLPTAPIEKLLQESAEVGVQIRKTRNDESLIRLGVTGGPGAGKPDRQEIGMLVQLVAHQPPQILWVGPGDQVVTEPNGCITEQRIEFELLFRTRLERLTVGGSLPDATGKVPPQCPASGPSTQETVPFRGVPLPSGRYFGEGAAGETPKKVARPD
jgi:hypothetical protein